MFKDMIYHFFFEKPSFWRKKFIFEKCHFGSLRIWSTSLLERLRIWSTFSKKPADFCFFFKCFDLPQFWEFKDMIYLSFCSPHFLVFVLPFLLFSFYYYYLRLLFCFSFSSLLLLPLLSLLSRLVALFFCFFFFLFLLPLLSPILSFFPSFSFFFYFFDLEAKEGREKGKKERKEITKDKERKKER